MNSAEPGHLFLKLTLRNMIPSNILKQTVTAELRPVGFARKGSAWYLQNEKIIAVVNLQKSEFGTLYFLNIGFWLREIEDIHNPKVERCHVQARAEGIWKCGRPSIADLLDLENSFTDDASRLVLLRQFVREQFVPFVRSGSTVSGLKSLLTDGREFLIRRDAWDILGIVEL